MPVAKKNAGTKKKTIRIQVGSMTMTVEPLPDDVVAKANARIQKQVQPVFGQVKKNRRAAAITASKIILNA
jgi:hypothetical protein